MKSITMKSKYNSPIIVMGVAGCGKTTIGRLIAKKFNYVFFDADDFHSEASIEKMKNGIPLNDEDRTYWLVKLNNILQQSINKNEKMVLACSALKERYRDVLSRDLSPTFIYLKISMTMAISRLKRRKNHFFKPSLITDQFKNLEEPSNCIVIDANKPIDEILQNFEP